jgi:hypothetical protein
MSDQGDLADGSREPAAVRFSHTMADIEGRRKMRVLVVLVSCLAVLAATPTAEAQGVANSFAELRLLVKPGDTVSVTGTTGGDVTGKIAQLSSSALALVVHGQRRDLRESDVTTIRQRRGDSLQNGALAGLCVGAGLPAALFALSGAHDVDGGMVAMAMLIYGGVGAGIGAGVDALIVTRPVIYQRGSSQGASLRISPILTAERQGALVSIRF